MLLSELKREYNPPWTGLTSYTFWGSLLSGGQPVSGRQITFRVNGMNEVNATVQPDGSYSVTLNLPAVNNEATDYQVEAIFYGDNSFNLTEMVTLPNVKEHAACMGSFLRL